jgi:hypothetical protein
MANDTVPKLRVDSIMHLQEGLVMRLTAAEPAVTVGGGGLVWVDAETGCATVLARYE